MIAQKSSDDNYNHRKAWALYARSATSNPVSICHQLESCLHVGQETFKEDPLVFFDQGTSGMVLSRDGLSGLFKVIAAGNIQAVVVQDVERLSRNWFNLLRLLDFLDAHQVDLMTLDGGSSLAKVDRESVRLSGLSSCRRSSKVERKVDA